MSINRSRLGIAAVLSAALVTLVVGCGSNRGQQEISSIAPFRTTSELVSLVNDAAAKVKAEGQASFAGLAKPNSGWNEAGTNLFVWDAQTGKVLFDGSNPGRVGSDARQLAGGDRRPWGQWAMDGLGAKAGYAWSFYMERPQSGGQPQWKAVYVTPVSGGAAKGEYVVGCEQSDLPVDAQFLESLVKLAAARIEREGPAALELVRQKDGPFVYKRTQIFVIDSRGNMVANALYPGIEGRYQTELLGGNNRPVQELLVGILRNRGEGWATGYPGGRTKDRRDLYIKRITLDGQTMGVGASLIVE